MFKRILLCCMFIFFSSSIAMASSAGPESVEVSVTVIGDVFALDLQDSGGFPWSGQLDLGLLNPGGEASFPPDGVLVAACKSNHGFQWELQLEGTTLTDEITGIKMAEDSLLVRGYDSIRTGGIPLPGALMTVPRAVKQDDPITVYTSNSEGDAGFNGGYGTFVPLGFGVKVPGAQQKGTYTSRVTFIMTE